MLISEIILESAGITFIETPFFQKTSKKWLRQALIQKKFVQFMDFKESHPFSAFGGKDYTFAGKSPLGNFNVKHAGLTGNVSVIYKIIGNVIKLYAIGSHDDFGIGNPANIKRQQQIASKIKNQ